MSILTISHKETEETQGNCPQKGKALHLNPPEENGDLKPNSEGITRINSQTVCEVPSTVPDM